MKGTRPGWMLGILLLVVCSAGIGTLQPRLATTYQKNVRRDDVFVLPPPTQLRAMTLGYKGAAADLLWAKLIVEHGLHWEQKRAFPDVRHYIDGILALDPSHPMIYDFVDTLLLFNAVPGTEVEARLARGYFEQGTRDRPYDTQVWLRYGQFLAFLAPSFLKDQAEIDRWKRDGAFAIGRAVELGADPDRTLSVTSILGKAGERKAMIAFLQRAYALTDDLDTRLTIKRKLQALETAVDSEATLDVVEDQWRTRFPSFSRTGALLLGPYRDPAACAGSRTLRHCPQDWTHATRDAR